MLTLTNLLRFSITSTWDVLNVTANRMRPLLKNTQRCLNHVFLLGQRKSKLATLRIRHQPRGEVLCIFGRRTRVSTCWMCKKQTSVSHSSTESEIISLDAELRIDGLLALDLWDVVIEVLCSTNSTKKPSNPASGNRCETGNYPRDISKLKHKENRDVDQLLRVDHVATNAHSFQGKSQLYTLEDNVAVIKMIIKGRSPTIRHVSRTHRSAIDPLFDRINLDSRIQIKYVDTKNQFADV